MRRLGLVLLFCACGGGGGTPVDAGSPDAELTGFHGPDDYCPGNPHCAAGDGGRLFVGAAGRDFTPTITETYTDENGDGEWEDTEPYVDANGNGKFDGCWMFGGGRAANTVYLPTEARALVFREGDTEVAIVYIDAIGVLGQGGDLQAIEEDPRITAAGIDHVVAGATHSHDSRDMIGLWGPTPFDTSYDPDYNQSVREAAIGAILDAAADMHEAHATTVSELLLNVPGDPSMGTDHWNLDTRDPVIFDPTLTASRFTRVDNGATIGTLVHWANHPEGGTSLPNRDWLSSDWPHWLRDGVENGVPSFPAGGPDIPGLGGVTVFAQGPLGGQVGNLNRRVAITDQDGTVITDAGHAKDKALGINLAREVLRLFATSGEEVSDLPVSYRTTILNARIDNTGFQVAFLIHLLAPHTVVGYDPDQAVGPGNAPWLPLRVSYLQVGPIGMVTMPGELHPELWVGGYDCSSWTFGYDCYDPTLPNLPDFSAVPQAPYLRDLVLANPGVTYPILLGLAHDYVGYIVPAYDYTLNPDNPYLTEADGDHYEETYSLGPDEQSQLVDPVLELVSWRP